MRWHAADTRSSGTKDIQQAELILDGRKVILIDSPGFDDTDLLDVDILRIIGEHLKRGAEQKKNLSGLLYLRRITDNRMQHSAHTNVRVLKKLCGQDHYGRVALVTTHWDAVPLQQGEARENELRTKENYWGEMIKLGATVNRHNDTPESALAILRQFVRNPKGPFVPKFQEEFIAAGGNIGQTGAGQEIVQGLIQKLEEYEVRIKKLMAENQKAKQEKRRTDTAMAKLCREIEIMKEDREKQKEDEQRKEEEIREALSSKEKLIGAANAERVRVDGEIAILRTEIEVLKQKQVEAKSLNNELTVKQERVDEIKVAKGKAESEIQHLQAVEGESKTHDSETKAKEQQVAAAQAAKAAADNEMKVLTAEIERMQLELDKQKMWNEDLASKLRRLEQAKVSKQDAEKKKKNAEVAMQNLRRDEAQLEHSKRRESTVNAAVEYKERQVDLLDQEKQSLEGEIEYYSMRVRSVEAERDQKQQIYAAVEKKMADTTELTGNADESTRKWKRLPYCNIQ